ncbi:MAG: HAD family hydrolase [Pseudomonadota bacterium]|nr:HAD family hydrolase [Pseudomonadota bacterium]
MTPHFPRAVIFDWDNTLIDSWPLILRSMNRTLADCGRPTWSLDEVKARSTYAAKEYFPHLFGKAWEDALARYYTHYAAERSAEAPIPLPGARGLLDWLQTKSIPAFVVSNKRGDYLRQEASSLGWDNLFVALVGANDTAKSKPARDPVDLALSKGGLKAGMHVWFVGDTEVDMTCAHNAGCTAVWLGSEGSGEKPGRRPSFASCSDLQHALSALASATG